MKVMASHWEERVRRHSHRLMPLFQCGLMRQPGLE